MERREATSGVREARRADWADWRVGSGRSSKCCGVDVSKDRSLHVSRRRQPGRGSMSFEEEITNSGDRKRYGRRDSYALCL